MLAMPTLGLVRVAVPELKVRVSLLTPANVIPAFVTTVLPSYVLLTVTVICAGLIVARNSLVKPVIE